MSHVDRVARSESRERRLRFAIGLNTVIVVVQVVFGIVAGSLGLLSDAAHNLTDVAALVLSMIAIRVARRPATASRSFGWHRGTVLAAQANAALIIAMTVWIAVEAIQRLADPPSVDGGIVVAVALVGFVANAGAAWLVREPRDADRPPDLNMRSALLHLVSDALASLGVAAAGAVMVVTGGWNWLDPTAALVIAALIGWHGWRLLVASNAVLLEGTPDDVDLDALIATMVDVPGVDAVHDLHVWAISSDLRAMSAHVVVSGHPSLEVAQDVAASVRSSIAESDFGITHATLELECESCEIRGPACDMSNHQPARAHHGHHH